MGKILYKICLKNTQRWQDLEFPITKILYDENGNIKKSKTGMSFKTTVKKLKKN